MSYFKPVVVQAGADDVYRAHKAIELAQNYISDVCYGLDYQIKSRLSSNLNAINTQVQSYVSSSENIKNSVENTISEFIQLTKDQMIESSFMPVFNALNGIALATNDAGHVMADGFARLFNLDFSVLRDFAGATVATSAMVISDGVVHSFASLIESVFDLGLLGVGIVESPGSAIGDFTSWLMTGEDAGLLDNLWSNIRGAIQVDFVDGLFDDFYKNNFFGKLINENAITPMQSGGALNNIVQGIGSVAWTLLPVGWVSVFTNIGKTVNLLPVVMGSLGFINGTEKAWDEGAETWQGLVYGATSGIYDFFTGYFSKFLIRGGSLTFDLNVAAAIISPYFKSFCQQIYSDDSYFDIVYKNGGLYSGLLSLFNAKIASKIVNGIFPILTNENVGAAKKISEETDNDLTSIIYWITKRDNISNKLIKNVPKETLNNTPEEIQLQKKFNYQNREISNINKRLSILSNTTKFFDNFSGNSKNSYVYGSDVESVNSFRLLTEEFRDFQNFGIKLGFHNKVGSSTFSRFKTMLSSDTNASSYELATNIIANNAKKNFSEFKQVFGFDLINTYSDVNTAKILSLCYLKANDISNGGKLFTKNNGSYEISEGVIQSESSTDMILRRTLKDFGYEVKKNPVSIAEDKTQSLLNSFMKNGYSIELDFSSSKSGIILKGLDGANNKNINLSNGKSLFVTGATDKGVTISYNGSKYLIDYDTINKNSHEYSMIEIVEVEK